MCALTFCQLVPCKLDIAHCLLPGCGNTNPKTFEFHLGNIRSIIFMWNWTNFDIKSSLAAVCGLDPAMLWLPRAGKTGKTCASVCVCVCVDPTPQNFNLLGISTLNEWKITVLITFYVLGSPGRIQCFLSQTPSPDSFDQVTNAWPTQVARVPQVQARRWWCGMDEVGNGWLVLCFKVWYTY